MAVQSYREILPRTFAHKLGEAPTAQTKWNVTVSEPVPHQTIINAIGIFHGTVHPEYTYLYCTNADLTETDRFHVEVVYSFELPKGSDPQQLAANPLARPDVWSFSTGGAQVPALVYYDGNGNGDKRPLVNAANDYFEGLTTAEAEVRATIAGNRAAFPSALAAAVTNAVNDSPYLFGAKHTWQCSGISASQQSEVVNGVQINYWQVTAELVYRASGHNLLLPHIGWNYIATGSQKRRVYVYDDDGNKVPAGAPQPLNSTGGLKTGTPDILERRVYPEVNFSSYFGTPPF
jgi:hypothetical protein